MQQHTCNFQGGRSWTGDGDGDWSDPVAIRRQRRGGGAREGSRHIIGKGLLLFNVFDYFY